MDTTRVSQIVKYSRVCAQCEKPLPESARFCPRCGSGKVVDRSGAVNMRVCSHCKSGPIMGDSRTFFCPACGSRLSDYVGDGRMGPPPLPPPIPRRKRRFFLILPLFCLFFFGITWSWSSHRPEPVRLHDFNPDPSYPAPGVEYGWPNDVGVESPAPMYDRPLIVGEPAGKPRTLLGAKPQPVKPDPEYYPFEK